MKWQSGSEPAKNAMSVKVGKEEAEEVDEVLGGVEEEGDLGGEEEEEVEGADSEVEVEGLEVVSMMTLMASCSRVTVLISIDEGLCPVTLLLRSVTGG